MAAGELLDQEVEVMSGEMVFCRARKGNCLMQESMNPIALVRIVLGIFQLIYCWD